MPITQCTATCDVLFILAAGRSELYSTLGLVALNLAQSFQSCFSPSALTSVSKIDYGIRIMIQTSTKTDPVRACLVFGNNGET
jgi:hypothetical protein